MFTDFNQNPFPMKTLPKALNISTSSRYNFSIFDYIDNNVFAIDEKNTFMYGNFAFQAMVGIQGEGYQQHIVTINKLLKLSLVHKNLDSDVAIFIQSIKREIMDTGALDVPSLVKMTIQKYTLRNDKKYVTGFVIVADQDALLEDDRVYRTPSLNNRCHLLTKHELKILRLMAAGHLTKEIACILGNSIYTIGNHQKSIYKKLNAHSKVKAIIEGKRQGLLSIDWGH